MFTMLTRSDTKSRISFLFLCFFLVIILLFGGASRADVLSQIPCRLAAIGLIGFSLMLISGAELREVRVPLAFLLAIAAIIAVQLVPLPYQLWSHLPGRAPYVQVIETVGAQGGWRPLSLTPDLTINSLMALLPAIAILLGLALIDRGLHRLLVPFLLLALLVTAVIGLLQISNQTFYFYQVTNEGSAVGVFANRNHQAVFLAAAFPLLSVWANSPHPDRAYARLRIWAALCMAAGLFPLLLITGSRAGLILAILSALLSCLLTVRSRLDGRPRSAGGARKWSRISLVALPLAVGAASVALVILLSKAEAIQRFFPDGQVEKRLQLGPVFNRMVADFFPFGSGFGSFDPVFRAYEPASALDLFYMNHAHNDFIQIVIEGGVLPLLLLVPFLIWTLMKCRRLWFRELRTTDQLLGRAGSIIVLVLLLSSLVEYPLRTPILSVLMTIACLWMRAPGAPAKLADR